MTLLSIVLSRKLRIMSSFLIRITGFIILRQLRLVKLPFRILFSSLLLRYGNSRSERRGARPWRRVSRPLTRPIPLFYSFFHLVNQHVSLFAFFFIPPPWPCEIPRSGEEAPYVPLIRRLGDCEWSTTRWTITTNSKKGTDRERDLP